MFLMLPGGNEDDVDFVGDDDFRPSSSEDESSFQDSDDSGSSVLFSLSICSVSLFSRFVLVLSLRTMAAMTMMMMMMPPRRMTRKRPVWIGMNWMLMLKNVLPMLNLDHGLISSRFEEKEERRWI